MARIQNDFDFGDPRNMNFEKLLLRLEEMYRDIAEALNKKPEVYVRAENGQTTDTFLNIGDININSSTNKIEMLVAHPTQTAVTWKEI
jgi:hypothetical protein